MAYTQADFDKEAAWERERARMEKQHYEDTYGEPHHGGVHTRDSNPIVMCPQCKLTAQGNELVIVKCMDCRKDTP